MTDRTVSLVDSVNNNTVELPVLEPVLGRPCIDISVNCRKKQVILLMTRVMVRPLVARVRSRSLMVRKDN